MGDATKNMIARDLAYGPIDLPQEPETTNTGITHEILAAHRISWQRYFIDEIGGDFFMIPIDRRMDWYDFDQCMEEGLGPEPLPDYARPIESLCHLEFEAPEEPFK